MRLECWVLVQNCHGWELVQNWQLTPIAQLYLVGTVSKLYFLLISRVSKTWFRGYKSSFKDLVFMFWSGLIWHFSTWRPLGNWVLETRFISRQLETRFMFTPASTTSHKQTLIRRKLKKKKKPAEFLFFFFPSHGIPIKGKASTRYFSKLHFQDCNPQSSNSRTHF